MGADVVICEEPFSFLDLIPTGQITYRDLFNTFRNDWIIKTSLDDRSLRKLFTMLFSDRSKTKGTNIIIDGLGLSSHSADSKDKVLTVNEIKDEQNYTVALRDEILSGQRPGPVPDNYKIVDQDYVVPLFKKYLSNNAGLNIDAELDVLEPKLF